MRAIPAIIIAVSIALTACNGDKAKSSEQANSNSAASQSGSPAFAPIQPIKPQSPPDPNFVACNPYFPLVPGSLKKYSVVWSSGLVADATVVVDAAEEDGRKVFVETTQIVDKFGGVNKAEKTVRKYVCDGERIQIIHEKTENRIDGKENTTDFKFRNVATAMIDPDSLNRKGSTWSYSFFQLFQAPGQLPAALEEPIIISFESQGEEELTVPAGKFKAIKVMRRVGQNQVFEYFTPGLGLIKRQSAEGTFWELKEYSGVAPSE
ncbi:MAG TPA: hypothetical protein VNO14_08030 [Blastocatellia bacterium]|nr:hypothetical protein [Blastocatellia bacterium]